MAAGAVGLCLAGCAASATYDADPLAQIGRDISGGGAAQFKNTKVGIVFSDNARKAIGVVTANRDRAKSLSFLATASSIEDLDPTFLTRSIDEILQRRFKDVVTLPDVDARREAGVDAVMVLDIQIELGNLSFANTTVALHGIFIDGQRNPIDRVDAEFQARVPYPASTYALRDAVRGATDKFAAALDGNTRLAGLLNAPPTVAFSSGGPNSAAPMGVVDGTRLALVIGNSAYKEVAFLPNPANDARLIAATLRGIGFEVAEVIDGDQATMKRAIQAFGAKLEVLGSRGVGLFFYAGHGVQSSQGQNYLIPVTAHIERETDLDIEAVAADWAVQQMDYAKSKVNIVILDACRNNPFTRGFRSVTRGLARMDAPSGTLLAYSTAPGDVASDGKGKNSPYSSALAQAMTTVGVPLEQAFKQVRVSVLEATQDMQTPWESSSLTGDFYFAPTKD